MCLREINDLSDTRRPELSKTDETALGAFYRRLSGRVAKAKAVTATARKIAVLFYNTLRHGTPYADPGASYYEDRYRERVLRNLQRRAKSMGFVLKGASQAAVSWENCGDLLGTPEMRLRQIEDHREVWPVRVMCDALSVSPSGYYAWRSQPASPRKIANRELLGDIQRIHAHHRGRYGAPRIHAELRAEGQTVGRTRIERVMRQHGIRARAPRHYRVCTTDSTHSLPLAPRRFATPSRTRSAPYPSSSAGR